MYPTDREYYLEVFHQDKMEDFVNVAFDAFDAIESERAIEGKTEDYELVSADGTIVVDASSNTVTITTPLAPTTLDKFNVACLDSTFTVEVDFNGKNYYKSSANVALFEGENLSFQYDGTQWVGAA